MSTDQKTILRLVLAIVAVIGLLFVGIPCCVTGFMVIKYRQAETERAKAEQELKLQRRP